MVAPGSRQARYERLAGDEEHRRLLFLVRAELGIGIDEWQSMPWWQQRVYRDGMNAKIREARAAAGESTGGDQSKSLVGGPWASLVGA